VRPDDNTNHDAQHTFRGGWLAGLHFLPCADHSEASQNETSVGGNARIPDDAAGLWLD
jgi:hypothetical protein